jgi:hypothetical protein
MTELTCPTCGETEELTGTPGEGDIEISCHTCGTRWARGARRCRGCGGTEQVLARQRMTANPRGNQLAVLGYREIPLCPRCDSDVAEQLSTGRLVPDGYTSRFIRGRDESAPPKTRPNAAAEQPPHPSAHSSPEPISGTAPPQQPEAQTSTGSAVPPRRDTSPTVRQAIESYLQHTEHPDAATAMLLLGMALGPATRLSALRATDMHTTVARTLDRHCGTHQSPRRAALDSAIGSALRYWSDQRWITPSQMRKA